MNSTLIVSPSPHVHSGDSIGKNMYGVLIALVPAFLVSLYCFGLGALIVTLVSVVSCVLAEYLIQKYLYKKEPTVGDGSAILTGVLLAFNLPSNLPYGSLFWGRCSQSASVKCRSEDWVTISSILHWWDVCFF